jgi:hypothetical protein
MCARSFEARVQFFMFFYVLLTVHHCTLMNQHQLDTLSFVCLRVNACTCFGRYSSIFSRLCTVAVWCNCVQMRWNRNLHAVNTHPTHAITPNSNCAEPPEDGRVTPETSTGIDSE